MFLLFLLFSIWGTKAQIVVIDPAAAGGFESGSTFAANGWSVAQAALTTRVWQIGTGQAGYSGTQAAFIGNNGTTVGTTTSSRKVHLYRSITIPAGAENIILNFKYKQAAADYSAPTFYDYIQVYTASAAPVSGSNPTGTSVFGPFPTANVTTFTNQTATLPNSIAGTTTNLVFTFTAETVSPHGYGAIDDVSLTYTLPTCSSPSALATSALTATSSNFSWTAPASPPTGGYQYEIRTSGAAGSGGAGLVDSGTAAAGVTTASTSLLSQNTAYTFYVRSNCGSEFSNWSSLAFSTPALAATPFNEGFATTTTPTGWTLTNFSIGNNSGTGGNPLNAPYINLYSSVTTGNFTTINVGPVLANQVLTFDYRLANFSSPYAPPAAGSGNYVVAISTNYGASYTTLETVANDAVAGWRTKTYPLTSYVGQNVKIRITGNWTSGDYYLAFDNFKVSATCAGTPAGGSVAPLVQSACSGSPLLPLVVTGASVDSGISYQWEQSTDNGANWGNAVGGTGATTTSYTPPNFAGATIQYRLKTTCASSALFAYSPVSEINSNPNALPLNQPFTDINTLGGWSQSGGFGVGTARGATGNPGSNAFVNLYSSNIAATFTTAKYGPVTAGQAFSFDLKVSNYDAPNGPAAAGWGSINVQLSTDCGATFTTVTTINDTPTAAYKNYKYYLGGYVGQSVLVRLSCSWTAGDYDISVDNFKLDVTEPVINSFTPLQVCNVPGNSVTITGFGFTGASAVQLNGVAVASYTVDSDTSISAVLSNTPTTGYLSVTNAIGTGTSTTQLVVNANPTVADITAAGGATNVCMSDTLALSNTTPTGNWSSSDVDVATINSSGVVTPVGVGNVVISYTVTDGVTGCTTVKTYALSVSEPVAITASTPTQTVVTGGDTSFSVTATGTGNPSLTYQWEVCTDGTGVNFTAVTDDAVYSGSNSATLLLNDVPVEFNGYFYQCTVTGICNSVISDLAVLFVGETGISTQPQNATICDSGLGNASFTVVASEDVTAYQWQEDQGGDNWQDISNGGMYSGTDTATLSLSGVTIANSGWRYKCIVTGIGTAESNPATLTVVQSVSVTTDPAAQTVCYTGGSASFSVAASGGVSSYQWQYSSDNGANWNNVVAGTPAGASYSGAATTTLNVTTTAATPAAGTHHYRALVNAAAPCANMPSAAAQLIINNPSITTQPAATAVSVGSSAALNVVANTMIAATYQWQYATAAGGPWNNVANNTPAGVSYTGGTSSSLSVAVAINAAGGSANYYRVVVSSGLGCSVNSAAAQLTINGYCQAPPNTLTSIGDISDSIVNVVVSNTSQSTSVSQASSGASPWYTVYNNTPLNATQGNNMSVAITFGSDTTQWSAAWVDFNRNGTFESSENVGLAAAAAGTSATVTYNFTVPFSATPGLTRIRVRGGSDSAYLATGACGSQNYGETEDYILNIVAAAQCSTPAGGTIASSVSSVCNSGSAVLTATGYTSGEIGISMQWHNSQGPIALATNPTYTTPVLTASETYFLRVTCANGGAFADSNSLTINVNSPTVTGSTPGTRCGVGTVALEATGSAGANLVWYTASTGGTAVGTGSPFTTPSISATTNYYVAAEYPSTGIATIGAATTLTGAIDQPTAFCNRWPSYQGQYLFTASELNAAGLRAGNITSVSFNITTLGDGATNANYKVAIGATAATAMTTTFATGLTTVFGPVTYTHAVGLNTVNFTTPYNWDGTSNIIVEVTHNGADLTNNSQTYYTATTGVNTVAWGTSGATTATTSVNRLNMGFGGQTACASARTSVAANVSAPPALTLSSSSAAICAGETTAAVNIISTLADFDTYVWSPSTGVSGSTGSGYTFNPASTTTYTLTATQTGGAQCQNAATFTVTVNPLPQTLAITPSSATLCSVDAPVMLSTVQGSAVTVLTENFNASAPGWTITSAGSSPAACNWQYPNTPYTDASGSATFLNFSTVNGGKFALSNSDAGGSGSVTNTVLTSPTFSTVGLPNAALTFEHAYQYWASGDTTVKLEISTNGGSTWTQLVDYKGTSVGATTNNGQTTAPASVSLNAYLNQSNLKIRYNYVSTWGYYWIIDNVKVASVPGTEPVTWAPTAGLYTDAAGTVPYAGGPAATIYAKPAATATYTATATTAASCSTSTNITLTVNNATAWYVDADSDGYGNSALPTVMACSQPAGHAAQGGDCNDTVAAIHPNAVEVPFNGVDDDCDGSIDETGTVNTTLLASSCGVTLASIGSIVGIQTVGGHPITGYRIRITNGAEVQVLEKTVPHFTITQFPSYAYATTYTVDIQLQRAGIWQASWGATCLVSTPAILEEGGAASVSPSQCGITLPKINTLIATTSLAGVTGYRFRVTNLTDPLGPNAVQTIDRTQNWFSLPMLSRYNYGSLYRIEVAVKTTGAFGGFGSPCEVSSPAVPSLVNCGGTVASGTTTVYATSVEGATQYRFQIVRQSDNASTTIDRNSNWFIFNSVPASAFTAGGLYAVRVAVMTKGTWSPFGDACEITAPGAVAKGGNTAGAEASVSDVFKATAYPNPYTADFSLDVITSSKENVQLQVYDMLGKLIETREVKFAELDMTKVGAQYPSGVYNVIVSQEGIVRTLRVIKR